MSKFIENLTLELSGRRKALPINFHASWEVESVFPDTYPIECLPEHRIETKYSWIGYFKTEDTAKVLDLVRRDIRRYIYGDLEGLLQGLEEAVYQHEYQRILNCIAEIRKEIRG